MERICFTARIRKDRLAEYRSRHADVWPEMLDALRDTGWHNYSLFVSDDGLLVGYLESEDYDAALSSMAKLDVNARWQKEMQEFFEIDDGKRPDEAFMRLSELFHLD